MFPEDSEPARIPTKFGQPSSVFTQRFSFYQNTGNDGHGTIIFAPQDVVYKPLLVNTQRNPNTLKTDPDQQIVVRDDDFSFQGESSHYILDSYTSVRLVGASIKVSYIGRADEESGYLVGSQLYGDTPFAIGSDAIEEGYHRAQGRPMEGLRFVYLPRNEADLDMKECNYKLQQVDELQASADVFRNEDYYNSNEPVPNGQGNFTTRWAMYQHTLTSAAGTSLVWADVEHPMEAPSKFWGIH